ncbi:MAG: sulfatase-like hydrolase/transferase, partial [Planctomycetaceae bacterium]
PAGYRSYAVGKWHVTRHTEAGGPKHNWPLQRGFAGFYGTIHGAGSFYDPSSLVRDNQMISPYADPQYQPQTYYYTDAITDHAIGFVRQHTQQHPQQPFFLYVAWTAAHWPMHALPEDIARYRGHYDQGYQPVREARFRRAAELGLIDPAQPMAPGFGDWNTMPNKAWESACMEVYAAMVDRMDQGIGRLMHELQQTGQAEQTLVFYLQDNGGCAETMGRTGNRQHPDIPRPAQPTLPVMKPEEFAAGGSTPAQTRDGFPVRMGKQVMPGPADTYVAYGRAWATVSNTPFREYKHWVHEGGISTPLIVHWPAGIAARGELRHTPGHLIDIAATCCDVAGASVPATTQPLEGLSLLPVFAGQPLQREALYWEHEGNRAVRAGRWKLVAKHDQPWELYDVDTDRVESRNLAAAEPDKVRELSAVYDRWAARASVAPWPLPETR